MTKSDSQTSEAYVSTAPETSALGKGGSKAQPKGGPLAGKGSGGDGSGSGGSGKKKASKGHPWRDNIEAVAISIVTIVLFKYFVLEAYKIPTGSMQPTLMGNTETGIFDRVIVDKLSYHFRDPERFEIAVFKYPLDSSKNFIKRIVGMPGEWLGLRNGDPWVRKDGEDDARVLRRPRRIQNAQLRRLETKNEWRGAGAARDWRVESSGSGDRVDAQGTGTISFPRSYSSIRDDYLDGYPKGMKKLVDDSAKGSNANDVTDLRVRFRVEADANCREVVCTIHEGRREFDFILPGPAADAGANARVEAIAIEADALGGPTSAAADPTFRLGAGDSVDVEVQNLNDLLEMRIGGDLVLSLEVPPMTVPGESRVTLAVDAPDGAGAALSRIKVWRDIYYTTDPHRQKVTEWQIPEGHYVVLGDNSQDSSDGRDWSFARFRERGGDDGARTIRGNLREGGLRPRPDTNPRYVPNARNPEQIFFHDDLGERHVFDASKVERLPDTTEEASLVPRSLVRGRAVLVVWPLAPQHDVYRWKWVR